MQACSLQYIPQLLNQSSFNRHKQRDFHQRPRETVPNLREFTIKKYFLIVIQNFPLLNFIPLLLAIPLYTAFYNIKHSLPPAFSSKTFLLMCTECTLFIGWLHVDDIQYSLSTTYICFVQQLLNKEEAKKNYNGRDIDVRIVREAEEEIT